MPVSVTAAAKYICEKSGWTITQLALQKILYLAHMVHLGRASEPLVHGDFEAWDYGPVHPILYHKIKAYGSKPVPKVLYPKDELGPAHLATLNEACERLLKKSPGELVQNTHWENGAWAKNYSAGAKGIVISEFDIVQEYNRRMGSQQAT